VLNVVDNIKPVEEPKVPGHLELRYVGADGVAVALSFPHAAPMHELVDWSPPDAEGPGPAPA
jgi:hypothetical protein